MNRIGVVGASGRTGRFVVDALRQSATSVLHAAVVSAESSRLGAEVDGTGFGTPQI